MKNTISFETNNGGILELTQKEHDGDCIIFSSNSGRRDCISNGDMVMLLDYYYYIKDNDIQNDFINYYGKNKEEY